MGCCCGSPLSMPLTHLRCVSHMTLKTAGMRRFLLLEARGRCIFNCIEKCMWHIYVAWLGLCVKCRVLYANSAALKMTAVTMFHCSFVARVLNPALLTEKLSSYGQRVMGASWAAPSSARAMTLTFADIDKTALSFPLGCEVRPYKHVLCYQAHLAQKQAAKQGWIQIKFDDFWGEDESYVAKVQHWLSKQTPKAYSE